MATKTATFKIDRETKGAIRLQEDSPDGMEIIGQLYVRKSGLRLAGWERDGWPKSITVTVEVDDRGEVA